MRQLLRVELDRLRWRRAVRVLLAACVLVPAVIWVATWWNTRPHSAEDIARAEADIAAMAQEEWFDDELARCARKPRQWGVGVDALSPEVEAACRDALLPSPQEYLYRPQLTLRDEIAGSAAGVVALLGAMLLLAGTTFVGHDWNTGSMGNQLLFEPRRQRVWIAKGAVLLATGLLTGALVLGAYWGGLWLLAGARDLPPDPGIGEAVLESTLRGIVLCGGAALLGYALTTLFRSTVATLGIVFVVAVGATFVVAVLGGSGAERWMLHANVAAWLQGSYQYWVDDLACTNGEDCGLRVVRLRDAAVYLGTILVAAVAASLWSFRQRDVP